MKRVLITFIAAMAVVALAACSSGGGSSSAADSSSLAGPTSSASSTSSAGSTASSSAAAADAGDIVAISLDYSAGTGYEWQCSVEPEGVIEQVGQTTEGLAEGEGIAGGPLQDEFTFRAQKPGEAVITFDLVRSWEGEPAETQVYAFTVSDDLKMVLNPYKSDFENEPEWGSGS